MRLETSVDEPPTPARADVGERGEIAGLGHRKGTPRAGAREEKGLQQFLADICDDIYQGMTGKAD